MLTVPPQIIVGGYRVYASPILVDRTVTRVKGGFQYRWWIREVVTVPSRRVIISDVMGTIFAHPVVIEDLKKVIPT